MQPFKNSVTQRFRHVQYMLSYVNSDFDMPLVERKEFHVCSRFMNPEMSHIIFYWLEFSHIVISNYKQD